MRDNLWAYNNRQAAAELALSEMQERVGGCGGLICVSAEGEIGVSWTTPAMAFAAVAADGSKTSGSPS